jgi:hypothetical protein
MKIKEAFYRNIEENIAPVVYFHQTKPEEVAKEVYEYVITSRPRESGSAGIHEQFVSLLSGMKTAIAEKHSLPACWVSGYYGSGKSSLAKLLGLSLNNLVLPDGKSLETALLERDDTPNSKELHTIWKEFKTVTGKTIGVVFDIGASAKDGELVSTVIHREVRKRLGYSEFDSVAHFELILEEQNRFDEFLKTYKESYNKEWGSEKKGSDYLTIEQFGAMMAKLFPGEYKDQSSWLLAYGSDSGIQNKSIQERVTEIKKMMERRSPDITVFIVIDEMSQYIGGDESKMLSLQTLIQHLGAECKGKVWVIATGQEKLEEAHKGQALYKLQDRFPPYLRVHLNKSNVDEIIRRRLLKKNAKGSQALESLLNAGAISNLKLYGYKAEKITKEEIIDFYPFVPEMIDLILELTQAIRAKSEKHQKDSATVRGVMQVAHDIFNFGSTKFSERELGEFVTLANIFDIMGNNLGSDSLLTLDKIRKASAERPFALEVAKAISLHQLIQEVVPTTAELIAKLLYPSLGSNSVLDKVKEELNYLQEKRYLIYSEKTGYKIMSSAYQDWAAERDAIPIMEEDIHELVYKRSLDLFENFPNPVMQGNRFSPEFYRESRLVKTGGLPSVKVDLYVLLKKDSLFKEDKDRFLAMSNASSNIANPEERRFYWVCQDTEEMEASARSFLQSQKMYKSKMTTGGSIVQQMLVEEQIRSNQLESTLVQAVRKSWLSARIYFRGREIHLKDKANSLEEGYKRIQEDLLPDLFPHFLEGKVVVEPRDIEDLLQLDVVAPSNIFDEREGGLGILKKDAGKIVFTGEGKIQRRIKEKLSNPHGFLNGERILYVFGSEPFGYSPEVVKVCMIGLLRAGQIRIQPMSGNEITSIKDPGVKEVFKQDTIFKKAKFLFLANPSISPKDRIACARFFRESTLKIDLPKVDNDEIADAVYKYFPLWSERVMLLKNKLSKLGITVSDEIQQAEQSLSYVRGNRLVEETVLRLKNNLDILENGLGLIQEAEDSLTATVLEKLHTIKKAIDYQINQLEELGKIESIRSDIEELKQQMYKSSPWKDLNFLDKPLDVVVHHYKSVRTVILKEREEQVEESISLLKQRSGFSSLTDEEEKQVLQTIYSEISSSDPDAISPSLLVLEQSKTKIESARSKANRLLDQILFEKIKQNQIQAKPIKVVKHRLQERVIESEEDLDRILSELRESCLSELETGHSVRFEA